MNHVLLASVIYNIYLYTIINQKHCVMTTYTIKETTKEIEKRLKDISGSSYFTFEISEEKEIKIRVSDHSAKHANNDSETFSFCTNFVNHSDCVPMTNEWIVDEEGYCADYFQSVEEILDWELN